MRLTLVSPLVLHPPLSGGAAHIAQCARQLARFFQVDVCVLAPEPAAVTWGPLAEACASVAAFRRGPPRGSPLDPPAVRQEHSPELVAHLRQTWARQPPDIVQLEFTTLARYASLARQAGALVVCTAIEVGFRTQARRIRRERTLALRARRALAWLSMRRYELKALAECDLVIALSEPDAAALRRWVPGTPTVYMPSGVDLEYLTPSLGAQPSQSREVLFVGNFHHLPNLEGALWLAREVWPLVRRARPDARLTLAGRAPPREIAALAAPDITVPGTQEDLRPLYAQAGVVAAPIFWGSGVRIKILEALAHGLPLVTTALAAEGIGLVHGQSALFAERPEEFAAALVRLLDDAPLRARLGAAGRALVEQRYDWNRIGERLAGLYTSMLAGSRR